DAPLSANRKSDSAAPAEKIADSNSGAPGIEDHEGELAQRTTPLSPSDGPPPAPSRATAVATPMARVGLAVTPWGEIYVDGKRKGVTPPLTEIRIEAGKHNIEIRNTTFPSYAQSVDLAANGSLKIRHKFQ